MARSEPDSFCSRGVAVFWFLLIALVVVVAAVTLAVLGGSEDGVLPEAPPQYLVDPLPADRPLGRADVEALRLPTAVRGYRMADVDDALSRLGAELAERDARIARLEHALAGSTRTGGPGLFDKVHATGSTPVVAEAPAEPEPPEPADAGWTRPEEAGAARADEDEDVDPWREPPAGEGSDAPEGPKQ
uniref:DivIVA domain-containing protein n=1 Tax=Streptomyces polyasparticus TaxID=2767826 RepID=UPI001F1CEBEE|nr:DivIVA domain-containing protein [Streptomyces polyasparticus]